MTIPAFRQVAFDRPWAWLAAGWRDLWTHPGVSLWYGLVACIGGLLLAVGLSVSELGALIPVLAGGFALVGPVMALGLYDVSRRIERGEAVSLAVTLQSTLQAAPRIGLFAAFLLLIYLIWVRLAFLLLMLFLGTGGLPPAVEFVPTLLFTPHGLGLLVAGSAVGAALAAVVFALSAISIPMLMERDVDAVTAIAASVRSVISNPKAMGLWALMIAGFVVLGIATLGLGLVVIFPLIGHATWHAYRDTLGHQ